MAHTPVINCLYFFMFICFHFYTLFLLALKLGIAAVGVDEEDAFVTSFEGNEFIVTEEEEETSGVTDVDVELIIGFDKVDVERELDVWGMVDDASDGNNEVTVESEFIGKGADDDTHKEASVDIGFKVASGDDADADDVVCLVFRYVSYRLVR